MKVSKERRPKRCLIPHKAVVYARSQGLDTVTESTLKRAAYYGDKPLKRTKIGGRVYFAVEDLDRWIESCRHVNTEPTEPDAACPVA
jgi:hypothetical protein